MLTVAMQAMLDDEGVIFADTPIHLTHTALIGETQFKDLSPIGKQPFRFLVMALPNSALTVGILADIYTRIDLIFKAIAGGPLTALLTGQKASIVEI